MPAPRGSGNVTSWPDGAADDDVVDPLPRRHLARVEPEVLEQAQGAGGEAVAADLVPGEPGLVDDDHVAAGAGEGDGGGRAGRTGADDDDVGGWHQGNLRQAPGSARADGTRAAEPSPGRYVARNVGWSVAVGERAGAVVATLRQAPDIDSLMPVCSPVAYGVEYSVTVRLLAVYDVQIMTP